MWGEKIKILTYIAIYYIEIASNLVSYWVKIIPSDIVLYKMMLRVKNEWHLEGRHIVLDTADTVIGQWGQCDCSLSLEDRRWLARWV